MEGSVIAIRRDTRVRTPSVRINRRIRAREVRLVDLDGQQVGIVPTDEALRMAEDQGIDLVEVAPNAKPPVCRLMDYGKYKYEAKKQAGGKKQKAQQLKEVTFRPNIGDHDLVFKVNHIREFLEKGHKTKIRIFFRGREITHPEKGRDLAARIAERVSDAGSIDIPPKIEGKNLTMILTPKKKV